jgi:alpha-beta hydrolase superfamily lysophospholipase
MQHPRGPSTELTAFPRFHLLAALATLLLTGVACAADDPPPDFTGTWLGSLPAPGAAARVVFNISREAQGVHAATLDSPDEGAIGIPVTRVTVSGRQVRLEIDSLSALFSGQLSPDGQSIAGTATQLGESVPLTLRRQPGPLSYRRPQDPVPPYPYDTADVTVTTPDPAVSLACTASWPPGPGPFRTALLVTGSGPQDRNEELLNHRPFLVLADALARAGIASFRCDDRGFGRSTGDFSAATTLDFVADTRAALAHLRTSPPFPVGAIGLIGHSEGAMIAPLAADGDLAIQFLVLLAAPGITGEQILLSQWRAIATAQGTPPAQLDQADAINRRLLEQFRLTSDPQELDRLLREVLAGSGLPARQIEALVATLNTPWMQFFIAYDPLPILRRTRPPVLALNGTLDLQVLPELNLPAVAAALADSANPDVTTQLLPGLNHLFQQAQTGLPTEYARIDQTLSPEVLTLITSWLTTH